MILDASKAHAGDLALDYCAATGDVDSAAAWAKLLSRLDDEGKVVREVGGRCWAAFVECDLEDLETIRSGTIAEFLATGRTSGGAAMVIVACVAPERWAEFCFSTAERFARKSSALILAAQTRARGPWLVRPAGGCSRWQPLRGKPWEKAATFDEGMRLFFSGRN